MMQPEVASSDQQTASGHVVVLVLSHCTLRISRFSTANAAADKVQELARGRARLVGNKRGVRVGDCADVTKCVCMHGEKESENNPPAPRFVKHRDVPESKNGAVLSYSPLEEKSTEEFYEWM